MNKDKFIAFIKSQDFIVYCISFIVVSVLALHAYNLQGKPTIGIDDANITFVYAKNFANGHGFVYNIGGERVEGFTSMLWVLITSVFFKFAPRPELSIMLFNILILSFAITLTIRFFKKLNTPLDKFFAIVFVLWLFATPAFVTWSVLSLMEVGIYSVLLLTALISILNLIRKENIKIKDTLLLSGVLFLLVLARPESMMWAPFFVGCFALGQLLKSKRFIQTFKIVLLPALVTIASIAGLIAFRLWYFGYPLPNTYYAKVSHDSEYNQIQGELYFQDFLNSNGLLKIGYLLAILSVAFVVRRMIVKRKFDLNTLELTTLITALILLIGFTIPVYNGGDHFRQFRFYQPIWPIIILNALFLFRLVADNLKIQKIAFEPMVVVLVLIGYAFYSSDKVEWNNIQLPETLTIVHEFRIAEADRATGNELNTFFANSLPNIGTITSGGIKFAYKGEITDLLGLNNVKMAHSNSERKGYKNHAAFSKDVFYELKPDMLLVEFRPTDDFVISAPALDGGFWNIALKGMLGDREFLSLYTPAVITKIKTERSLFGFFRQDYLQQIAESGEFRINTGN